MLHRLRQVAFLVNDLPEAGALYQRTLGLPWVHSQELPEYGLQNRILSAGNGTYVKLLQATDPNSTAGRYLARRGEAPYLLIFETKQYDQLVPHLKSQGVRITVETQSEGYRSAFVHPASANGALLEIIEVTDPNNPWPPAGFRSASPTSKSPCCPWRAGILSSSWPSPPVPTPPRPGFWSVTARAFI